MPIYEYICLGCGQLFEKLQKSMDEPAPACTACGSADVRRELSAFAAPAHTAAPGGCPGGG